MTKAETKKLKRSGESWLKLAKKANTTRSATKFLDKAIADFRAIEDEAMVRECEAQKSYLV